ncbi:hypothetical protein A8C75_19590 [Marinobacterium aestuarii]|uniref:DUF3179 domain-containing protein n=1 Tax=Marinobacterium aestuarii TaxID=1821621 RepID=A0A1A9F3J4_9GAMM|nr:DUF3179 domain-containing protein [Marinobacterium aestuarii]ANG64458.1 hypothetical protein A8C75_19590 [Marinobacterium aestuarii]
MKTLKLLCPGVAVTLALLLSCSVSAQQLNGFDLEGALVPSSDILRGGPPRDGIPSIDAPRFVQAHEAAALHDTDRVMGLTRNGISKAYPIRILNWHEIVNDRFGDEPLAITFCPLCGSGMVFLREVAPEVEGQVKSQPLSFGVSGLLYNSDVLLYDRETESLWSQIQARALTGHYRGQPLTQIAVEHTSWLDWRQRHPDTQVLSFETGFGRDYDSNPYGGYAESAATYFPVKFRALGFHPKERVIGLALNGEAKAWPFVELGKVESPLQDRLGDTPIVVHFDPAHGAASIRDNNGSLLPAVTLYWFAWAAFHPDTQVFRQPSAASESTEQ